MPRAGDYTHKYNPTPRVSANQLAEYLSANATRRRRIIAEAKYPPTIVLVRYEDARVAISGHLIHGGGDSGVLEAAIALLKRRGERPDLTSWKRTNYKICGEALASFQDSEAGLTLGKLRFKAPQPGSTKLKTNGVTISVFLDAITERTDAGGQRFVGGVILVFAKPSGKSMNMPDRCSAIALLAHEVVKSQLNDGEQADPKMCLAIDVYGGVVYRAKSQQKQLLKTVELSCGEIATVWPTIEAPPDYNGPPIPGSLR